MMSKSRNRSAKVKEYAQANGISLQYIPAGQTGEWQPLDFRIFGSLKARTRAAFDSYNITSCEENNITINWELAIDILMRCWDEIPSEEIINSWSKFEIDAEGYIDNEQQLYLEENLV